MANENIRSLGNNEETPCSLNWWDKHIFYISMLFSTLFFTAWHLTVTLVLTEISSYLSLGYNNINNRNICQTLWQLSVNVHEYKTNNITSIFSKHPLLNTIFHLRQSVGKMLNFFFFNTKKILCSFRLLFC